MKKEIAKVLEIIKETNFDSKKGTKEAILKIVAVMDSNEETRKYVDGDDYDMAIAYKDVNDNCFYIWGKGEYYEEEEVIETFESFEFNCKYGDNLIEEMEKFINENDNIEFVNLTPHTITLMDDNFKPLEILESKGIVRAEEKKEVIKEINGVKIYKTSFENVNGLPKKQKNVIYIVSRIILDACKDRDDLVTTSQIVRKDAEGVLSNHPFAKGDIVGCQALSL